MTDITLSLTNEEAKLIYFELEATLLTDFPEPDPESEWYEEGEHEEWARIKTVYDRLHELISW